MSSDIIDFPGQTKLDIPPDRVLEEAKGELETCIIVGRNKDGDLWVSSSTSDTPQINWLLDLAKHLIARIVSD